MASGKIKIIFMGTDEIAVPSLKILQQDSSFEIAAVYTQPDKRVGRKQEISFSAIKKESLKSGLPIFQPQNIKEEINEIKSFKPDFIVVCSYGQILPEKLLNIPKYGAINIHFSLLPKYRGASPVQSAIYNGDSETGIAFFKMTKGLDVGPIYLIKREKIEASETSEEVLKRLSQLAAILLPEVLGEVKENILTPIPQDDAKATYCHILTKEDGKINFKEKTANEIYNQIRAYAKWPESFCFWQEKRLKIIEAAFSKDLFLEPGLVNFINKDSMIGCKQGALMPLILQLEGKKEMKITDFIRGQKDFVGSKLN